MPLDAGPESWYNGLVMTTTTTTKTDRTFTPVAPATIVSDPYSRSYIEREWAVAKGYITSPDSGPVLSVEVTVGATTNPGCDSNCYEPNTWGSINLTVTFWDEKHGCVLARALTLSSASVERNAHHKMPFDEAKKHLTEWLDGQVDAACEFAADICAEARAMVAPISVIEALRPRAIQVLMDQAAATLNARTVSKNDTVEVVRGRKVPLGTKGVVKWIGSNRFGTSVGILVPGKDGLVFTSIGNVERGGASQSDIIAEAKRLYLTGGYDKLFGAVRG